MQLLISKYVIALEDEYNAEFRDKQLKQRQEIGSIVEGINSHLELIREELYE